MRIENVRREQMEPLVSVIIPTYNRDYCIENAVGSVLRQDYENMEILIVDDGSTDDTEAVIKSIEDTRVHYYKNLCNKGAAATRNIGLRLAKGKYIAFQDSDDEWLEGKLRQQVNLLESSDCGMVYSCFEREFPDGRVEKVPRDGIQQEAKQGYIYPYLLAESFISTQTMLVRREILEQLQGFDESLKSYEDYDLAIRIAKCCQVAFIDEVLVHLYMMRGLISSCYLLKKYDADLKKYGIYEQKYKVIADFAEMAGCRQAVEKFLA
jgi:glycosyltransferase involved in cell wall biosynthesis